MITRRPGRAWRAEVNTEHLGLYETRAEDRVFFGHQIKSLAILIVELESVIGARRGKGLDGATNSPGLRDGQSFQTQERLEKQFDGMVIEEPHVDRTIMVL